MSYNCKIMLFLFHSLHYLAVSAHMFIFWVVSVIFHHCHCWLYAHYSIFPVFSTKTNTKNRCQLMFSFPIYTIHNVLFCDAVLPFHIYGISMLYLMHKWNMMTVISVTGNMTASYCKHHVAYLIRIVIERI